MIGKLKLDPADKVFSQYIRLRDKKCKRCHSPVQFNAQGLPISHQASHFQGRGKENTRFDPSNVDTLCGGCHQYFTANPGEHYEWQVQEKGQQKVDQIILASNMYLKKDRLSQKIYWTQRLKELMLA
jgi:hypothetical protein